MKRALRAAAAAACSLTLLLCAPFPAAAQRNGGGVTTPSFVPPELFEGFEPLPPDRFGFSPNQEYLVFQDDDGLTVVDLAADRIAFRERYNARLDNVLEVGFDPFDNRLFLLNRAGGGAAVEGPWRFRMVNPRTGAILFDRMLRERPEIRTNQNATVNLLVTRRFSRSEVLLLNGGGQAVRRQAYDSLVRWGISRFGNAIAFVTPTSVTRNEVEVINVRNGARVLSQRVERLSEIGFEPFGSAFVIATPLNREIFRVRMINGASGRRLVNQTFNGLLNVGFTPDSSYLGVVEQDRYRAEVFLFRTRNGRRFFRR